jgi:hypothetical protein
MANVVFTNNASALLAATITAVDTTIQVAAGFGDLFPVVTAPNFCYATLEDNAGNIEIVKVTARSAASDLLTVERGQEGTVAKAFTLTVTRVELRLTKNTMEEFAQINGYTMTGDADFNGNQLLDAFIAGPLTRFTAGQIAGVPLRGAVDVTSNEIAVPAGGGRATAGGATLLVTGDDIVAELDTAGVIILNSATVGVRIPASAYLRVEGSTTGHYFEVTHDDTDVNFAFGTATELNIPLVVNLTGDLKLNENELSNVQIVDFGIKEQSVTAVSTTDLDYTLGSYVNLALNVSISTLTFSNLPTVGVASFRLKVTKLVGSETITWPASFKWPSNGIAPSLSTGAGDIDFVDIWTDDGGTTWYGAYNVNWA